jgi:tetratricopeptide (TPR) repeat protein
MMRPAAILSAAVLLTLSSIGAIPTDPAACRRGGKLYFSQKIFDKAIAQLECAVEGKPDDYEAWLWLGRSYGEVGRYQDAARAFLEAEKKPKQKSEVANARDHYWVTQYNLGVSEIKKTEELAQKSPPDTVAVTAGYRAALQAFENTIALDPVKRRGYTYRGYVLSKLGREEEALGAFEAGYSMVPNLADKDDQPALDQSRTNLFQAYKDRGNKLMEEESVEALDQALDYYGKALAIDSTDVGILFRVATVHYQVARTDSTRKAAELPMAALLYEKVNEILRAGNQGRNDEDTLYNLTLVYLDMNDYASAERKAHLLVDANPKNPDSHRVLGRVYVRKGDTKAAFGELLVGGSLEKGQPGPTDETALKEGFSKRFGPTSDAAAVLQEKGAPQEARTHEESGATVDTWYYWDRGQAVAFSNGKKLVEIAFAPAKGS